MLRFGNPDLVRQELAAWAAGTEMTRGVARKGHRAGKPVRPREISHSRARRAVIAIRAGRTGYEKLTRELGKYRTSTDRNRHRARKSKSRASSVTQARHCHPNRPRLSSLWPTSPLDQRKHRQETQIRHS